MFLRGNICLCKQMLWVIYFGKNESIFSRNICSRNVCLRSMCLRNICYKSYQLFWLCRGNICLVRSDCLRIRNKCYESWHKVMDQKEQMFVDS